MHFPVSLRVIFVLSLAACSNAYAACSPGQILRDDVLIVVNDNSIDSPQVADHYCEQRGINPANIARVHVPTVNDIQLDQFASLRDQLIKFLLENTLENGVQPLTCDTSAGYTRYYCPETTDQIRRHTRIRYLVLTRGVPIRFEFTGSTLPGNDEGSIDNYLRFWLLNYFSEDVSFLFNQRAIDFADGRGIRRVVPETDRELIVGRIDGVNADSAKRLVDRAIRAEQNGIYGKLIGSKFGPIAKYSKPDGHYWKQWLDDGRLTTVYPSWHYLHGLFGELQADGTTGIRHTDNPQCLSYDADGKVPQECVTQLTEGGTGKFVNDPPPATPWGTIPRADRALVYQGYGDGFSSMRRFDLLLNWRESDNCNTLCVAGDTTCRDASTDSYRELDTRCVRLADGFIGYNSQSYSVGMMAAWPTGWFQTWSRQPDKWDNTGSNTYYMHIPEVRSDAGYDDNYSLWYRNTDNRPGAACYTTTDNLDTPPSGTCLQDRRINIGQAIGIPEQAVNQASPQQITIRFNYRALGLNHNALLAASLFVHESAYQGTTLSILDNNQIDYGNLPAVHLKQPNTPADGVSWGEARTTFTLDPERHRHPKKLFDGIKLRIQSIGTFSGALAIDNVRLELDGMAIPLINPGFDGGHLQLSGGDSAATFLSRLNGTAFWANVSHHAEKGHSFDTHPYETLIYFLRGLPLGDAVWFAETRASGLLYGDPLYSPIAVYLARLPGSHAHDPEDHFITTHPLALQGSTLNGSGAQVTTRYSIDYCSGHDFLPCDRNDSWIEIPNLQDKPGGSRNMALGNWDITAINAGAYTLRLAVTSFNATRDHSQTFYDYYPVTLYDPQADTDADGLGYATEVSIGTNPWADDTDADGMPDGWEARKQLDPLVDDANLDRDGDGVLNIIEYLRHSDPADPGSLPDITTHIIDPVNGTDNGRSPFRTIDAAVNAALAGDTLSLAPGTHSAGMLFISKPLNMAGPADRSALLNLDLLSFMSSATVTVSDLTMASGKFTMAGPGLNFTHCDFHGDTIVRNGASVFFTNTLFTNARRTALHIKDSAAVVLNHTTVTGNPTGIRADPGSSIQIRNSIITHNTSTGLAGVAPQDVSYSLIGNPYYVYQNGNISGNPLFVDAANGDYHLQPQSPAIDAGDPAADYSQEPASMSNRVNMGAYGNTVETAGQSCPGWVCYGGMRGWHLGL